MPTKTASRSRSQGNYITPNTAEGKKILNYLRNRCEKALDYCLENGLTSVEDFADAIEELTEADGKPGISVEVKHNGLVLCLSDRPEYGSTTGKYMMEHLGEPDDNRFTKTGIEALLDSPRTKTRSKKDNLLDELDDEQPSQKSKSKAATKSKKDDLLDELEDNEPSSKSKSKAATKSRKDDLLDELEDDEPSHRSKSKANTKSKKNEIESWEEDEPSPNSKTKTRPPKDDLEELDSEEPLLVKSQALNRSPRDELSELDEFEVKEPQPKAKPQTKSHLQNSEREDLEDEELSAKSQAKRKLQTDEAVEVAESLARTPSKTRTSQQRPQGKKSNDQNIDSILDAAVQVSGRTAISGSEVEGTTVSGLSGQVAVLATLIGKKAASQIIEAALGAGKERQVADIVKRLKAQSQRADSLSQRVTNLVEADSVADAMVESETLPIAEPEPEPEQNILPEPDAELVSTPGMLLAKAVNKVHGKVDKISGSVRDNNSEKTASIKIDTEASFEEQLVQINEALNRLEKRLDTLEERIEALENKLSLQSETGVQAADTKVEPPDSSTPSLSDQFVQNATEIDEKLSLESTIPTSSANATAKKITVIAQNLTQDSQLAATLAKIYSLAEEEANAEGIGLEDGVDLGEAKLYVTNFDSSTAVSLKTKEGEEMFSAVQDKTGEWKVTNDFLKPEEKEELDCLKIFQQAVNQERLAEMVKRSNQDEISFTDSQGSRLDFEVEFSDKSKSKGTVKGFNSHSEIVFEASLQKGNVEVLLCDIPPEEVENLLSQQQLAQNHNSNKQEARKTEAEMEI